MAAVREPDAFYSFGGGTISAGILYRIPNSVVLLKGGWTHFGGGDGDGGTTKAGGPYLGLATMLRTYKHLGIRADLSVHRFSRYLTEPVYGFKVRLGIMFLPGS